VGVRGGVSTKGTPIVALHSWHAATRLDGSSVPGASGSTWRIVFAFDPHRSRHRAMRVSPDPRAEAVYPEASANPGMDDTIRQLAETLR
jgi:hypothetical protein